MTMPPPHAKHRRLFSSALAASAVAAVVLIVSGLPDPVGAARASADGIGQSTDDEHDSRHGRCRERAGKKPPMLGVRWGHGHGCHSDQLSGQSLFGWAGGSDQTAFAGYLSVS